MAAGRYRGPAARRADLHQGPVRCARIGDHRRVARPAESRRAARCAVDRAAARGGRGLRRQDQPARVRVRHDQRGVGVRARAAPARSEPVARWIVRRIRRVGGGRDVLRLDGNRHGRIDPHSFGRVRARRPEADARRAVDGGRRAAQHDDGPYRAAVPLGRGCRNRVRRAARRNERRIFGWGSACPHARDPARLFSGAARSAGRTCLRKRVRTSA